jgi:hypothetical protein
VNGICLLVQLLGSTEFARQFVCKKIAENQKGTDALLKYVADHYTVLLLFSQCILYNSTSYSTSLERR